MLKKDKTNHEYQEVLQYWEIYLSPELHLKCCFSSTVYKKPNNKLFIET